MIGIITMSIIIGIIIGSIATIVIKNKLQKKYKNIAMQYTCKGCSLNNIKCLKNNKIKEL